MFPTVLLYPLIAVIISLGGYSFYQGMVNESLETDVKNGQDAIVAYEALLRVKPFEAVSKEKKERADEQIDAITNDTNLITGDKWM